jgi:hypothetical protein
MLFNAVMAAALLLAEIVTALFAYSTMHQALDSGDAILLLLAVPALVLFTCSVALGAAIRDQVCRASASRGKAFSIAWALGALLGLTGLLLSVMAGPHFGPVLGAWSLGVQAVIYFIAHLARNRRQ